MGPKKKAKITIPHLRRQTTRLQAVHSETQSDRAAHSLPSVDRPPLSVNRMVESSPSIDYSNGDRVKRPLHSIPDIWHLPKGERIEMELNLLGQPIKKQNSKVVRFGGLIGKFKVLDDKLDVFKKWILKDLGKKWKDYKHELKKKLLNEKDISTAQVMARASPNMVDLEQLAELANLWIDPKYMVTVEMKELLTQDTNPIKMESGGTMTWKSDDVYSKVMGLERPRHVCDLGFGPTPTRKTCQHSLPTSNQEDGISNEEFDKMRNELTELQNLVNTFDKIKMRMKRKRKMKKRKMLKIKKIKKKEEDEEEEENDEDND
ncbi:hypothetical protein I3760_04G075800 [Carya illinoinensis]|nr:hypothetical protein I3760_04G075800 [Carya illinoinensis]